MITDRDTGIEMKLVVLGANGRTGSHVVRLALEEGATVTAVVRSDVKRPKFQHAKLSVAVGDPCDADFLVRVFRDHDTVVSALGGRRPSKSAMSVYPMSAKAIVQAIRQTGPKKVVVTSSALLFPVRRWIDKLLVLLVPNVVSSAIQMEQILRGSDLDVVVVRCGFLTDVEEPDYRAARDALPENGSTVSRRGLSKFILDTVREKGSGFRVYGVSRPKRQVPS